MFNVVCGNTYDFTYCEAYGGISTGWNAQLTLYNSDGTTRLCYSNDQCGTNNNAPFIRWTANFSGVVRLLSSALNCQTNAPNPPYNRLAYRTSIAPVSNVGITVYNISGATRSNAKVILYNWDYSQIIQTLYTNASGLASFNSLNNGVYNYEVYYTPTGGNPPISNEEFWGSGQFPICSAGQSIPITFNRNQPYISAAPSFSPSSLSIGQSTSGNFPVRSALPYSINSYVRVYTDRGQTSPYDFVNTTAVQAVNVGSTTTFTTNISPANTGTHYYYAFVYSFVNNNYIITDQYAWTTAFTVSCPSLPVPTSPTPGSTSSPGPILTTLTPTFSWNGNSSGVYHVQIWDAATNPITNQNVIYGFETPPSSPGHCVNGLSHTIPNGVLANNGQYKWRVHRNDPCGECQSSPTALLYFQINTNPCVAPSTQANSITFSSVSSDRFTVNWTNGNGSKRIVKINTANNFLNPVNGIDPQANNVYQNSGEQVVYNNSGSSVLVTGLTPNTNYWVRVYEANCSGTSIVFNTNTAAGNPNSQTTTAGSLPVPNFSTPSGVIIAGQSTTITNASSNATSYSWVIQREEWNGSTPTVYTSTSTNISFNFPQPACYKVSLTATNANGSNTLTRQCYIYATPNLTAPIPPDVTRAQKYYTYKGGDPVNLANGTFNFSMRDFSIPDVKTVLQLERRYFSNSGYDGPFGLGWHHSFDIKVNFSNIDDWFVQYPDGHNEHYAPYINGETRTLYPGNFDTLSYTSSGGTPTGFTLRQKDGTRWEFNDQGQIRYIFDLDNNQTTFSYSGGKLTTITGPGGRYLLFTYNASNKIITAKDNSNRTVYYYYDASNQYLDSTRIGNSITSFTYGPHGMTEVYDPNGNRIVQNLYNAQSQVYEQYDADNKKTSFQYNTPVPEATTVTDPLLKSRVVKHDAKSRCIEVNNELNQVTKYGYSGNNTLDTITDARNYKSIIIHDAKGNQIKSTNAKGFSDSASFTALNKPDYTKDKEGNISKIQYSATGNPTHFVLATGDTLKRLYDNRGLDTLVIDAMGNLTRKSYNSFGDLVQVITPTSVTTTNYDVVGRPVEIIDSYGRKDSLFWNHFDQLIKRKDKIGRTEEFGFDANGNQTSYKDKKGQITTTAFNRHDKPIRITEPQNHVTEFEYDDNQRKIKTRDPNRNTLIYTYDDAGRELSVADSILGVLQQRTYDPAGNLLTKTDALNKTWTNRIDEINRVTSTINPLGDSVQHKYNKNNQPTEFIDEDGKSTKWEYDSLGRHIKTTDARNNFIQRFLNKNGLQDSIRDARGNIRNKATYDGSDRMLTMNDGFGNYIMSWDSSGNIKTITDPDNRTLSHFYNGNNELTDIKAGATTLRHYVLDDNGDYHTANAATQTVSVVRNQLGWITQYTNTYSNILQRVYDSVGNVTRIIYPGGKLVDYKYNSLNKCIEVKDWTNAVYTIVRNNNGAVVSIQYPNNFRAEITRDNASRVSAWVNKNGANNIFQSNLLLRNKSGDILRDSGIHVLAFNPLIQAANGTYGKDDRLQTYGNAICTTNASGQRRFLTAPGKSYSYNWSFMGELTSTTHTGPLQPMEYDAFNERVTKRVSSTDSIRYIIDHNLASFPVILQERNATDQELINYVFIPGEGILLGRDSAGVFRYYHHDVKGNTIALSDGGGQITDRYEYGEFGDSIYHTGPSTQPFTWMGMYGVQHEGNGLYYLHARYYDGKTGSFISKDPHPVNYMNTQDIDRYVYGYNNPLKYIDPTGLAAAINNISYEETKWSKFYRELGMATQYLGPTWQRAMDHPILSGFIVGLIAAPAAVAGSQGILAISAAAYPGVGVGYSIKNLIAGGTYLYISADGIKSIPQGINSANEALNKKTVSSIIKASFYTTKDAIIQTFPSTLQSIIDIVGAVNSSLNKLFKKSP